MVGLLLVCSVFFTQTLNKYEINNNRHAFALEGEYIAENVSITLNSLVYAMLSYATADNLIGAQDEIAKQQFETLINTYPMISSVYITGFDGMVLHQVQGAPKKYFEISASIQNVLYAVLDEFDRGNNRGAIALINDPNLVSYEDTHAFVVLQPIYRRNTCYFKEIYQGYKVTLYCENADVLGFVAAVVPFEMVKNSIKIPLYSSGIDWKHLVISPVQEAGPDTVIAARSAEFAIPGEEPFLVEHKILVSNPFFDKGATFYVTLSSNKHFLKNSKVKIRTMIMVYSIIMIGIVILFSIGMYLTGNIFKKIRLMIDKNQVDKSEYTFTPAFLKEVNDIDRMLHRFWSRSKQQLTTIEEQSEQLKEYRKRLEERNKDLSNQVDAQLVELNKTMAIKSDMLASYRVVVDLSEALYGQIKSLDEISLEILRAIDSLRIIYKFCFRISLGGEYQKFYQSPGMTHQFVKGDKIDYSRYYYYEDINDADKFIVFPIKSFVGGHSFFAVELLNDATLSSSKIDGLALFSKVLGNCLDNIAMSKRMEMLANQDQLTMLYNRNAYIEERKRLADSNEEIGIFLIDINGLKEINDTFGHGAGDWLIRECASILKKATKAHNMSIYRLGGDEFSILYLTPKKGVVDKVIACFNEEMASVRDFGHGDYKLTFSYGYSEGSCKNIDAVFSKADALLYDYKKNFYQGKRDRRAHDR